jgi:hypothetical protein
MFLIDKPYVSDFLIKTLKDNNFPVISTQNARELMPEEALNWISEEEAIAIINNVPNTSLYLNSENGTAWIYNNLGSSAKAKHSSIFKDKFRFRELLKDSFPDLFYKVVTIEEIQKLSLYGIHFPFVIKPSVGFFSIGVYTIHNLQEWEITKKELKYENLQTIYPKEVLNTSSFIIEGYIKGEEYAVDCYFNNIGEVVILNILHHKFSSSSDINDRVYTTSKEIILNYKQLIEEFLQTISNKTGLRNFPAHVELRIDDTGRICPIEVNPLRFGGICSTGDLTWHAYGINSYEYFMLNKNPDWENIFATRNNKKYSNIVLNNNSGFAPSEIKHFDYDLLTKEFENILELRKMDIIKYGVFGFIFTETSPENEEELNNILISDLKKYITV